MLLVPKDMQKSALRMLFSLMHLIGLNHKKKMLLEIQKKTDAALEGEKQLKTLYCRVGERPGLGEILYFGQMYVYFEGCQDPG